jgi:hypothetical protein
MRVIAASIAALTIFAALRLPRAHAHAERTHGIAVMLAFQYLERRAAAGDAAAQAAIDFWSDHLDLVASHASGDPLGPVVLGWEPGTTVSASEAPAAREEPGLNGPVVTDETDPAAADKEFPTGTGALLASLTAAVDDHNDVWADAKNPFQVVIEKFDDKVGNIGATLLQEWADDTFDGPGSDNLSCSGDAEGFWEALGCAVLDVLLWFAQQGGGPFTLLIGAILSVNSDGIKEGVSEDIVSGCESNAFVQLAIDKQFPDMDPSLKEKLAADTDFWSSLGIDVGTCGAAEELLEDITQFRTYGSPDGEADALFTIRARLADYILACDAAGGTDPFDDDVAGDLAECAADETLIAQHFRTMDPWALSSEGVEKTPGAGQYAGRWSHSHNFTTLTHFQDMLSLADGTVIDFSDPSVDVSVMKGPHGLLHPWDGFSLGGGVRFDPMPAALTALTRGDTDALAGAVGADQDMLDAAADYDLFATTAAIGHLILRRRVCAAGLAGLTTSDGLGASQCGPGGAVPDSYADQRMVEEIFPPAEMGALDGFTRWAHGDFSAELVDATTQTAFSYYDLLLSFAIFLEDQGGTLPATGPFTCASPLDCVGNRPRWVEQWNALFDPGSVHRDALRLRGLALALHMVQDLTVPHHIAPTTAYGHSAYETWFSGWLFPTGKDGKTLRSFENVSVDAAAGAYSIGQPSTATNRWQANTLDGSGVPRTTNAMWEEIDALNEGDPDGFQLFWWWVDSSWDQLDGDMTALVGGDCEDRFSVRALARAVAFQTAKAVAEEGKLAPISGLNSAERAQAGFWIMSALSVVESTGSSVPSDIEPIEVPTWRPVAGRTLPFLVAATARLLQEAARAHQDASTTCDSGEDGGPPLDGARPAEITALSCEERRRLDILACYEQPGGAGCAQYAGLPGYDECAGPGGPYASDGCGDTAVALAACACKAAGSAPIGEAQRARVSECLGAQRTTDRVRDLERSGEIDHATALFQTGQGPAADRDGDGIPDGVDDCPGQGASIGVWPGTTLDVGVCWRRAAGAGTCRYGCPLPRGDEDRS